jgi:hypothetical protein
MGIERDHGPEGAAVPWMDGWMEKLSSAMAQLGFLVLGANNHNDSAPNINYELKKKVKIIY